MHKDVIKAIDLIDATVINGDSFLDDDNREHFRNMMVRWEQQLKNFDDLSEELKEVDKNNE